MPCCWKCVFRPRNTVICPGDATPPILSMICPPCPSALLGRGHMHISGIALLASGWFTCGLAQQRAARHSWQAIDAGTRGEEENAPILTPSQIRRQLRQQNAPQPFAIWAAYPHTARSRAEHVAMQVDLEAVRHAWVRRCHVQ